ncbi:E3 ubiquitin-protein ligase rnf213-alpha-like isoform X2 [Limulus polyphemus]|uniref:E3 ubiquitin-protein ligase rnf213-alpha-like isoform X2 n=1 Tax=Limulus polyphemus TaxID=6850 RepID=A0ABM1T450_LIMPO|nr:E3 ubiquitin-protein ligase rnf213-alpha-like isoform X2 [Limulus polyphemus]
MDYVHLIEKGNGKPREEIHVQNDSFGKILNFSAEFPFSWLVIQHVEEMKNVILQEKAIQQNEENILQKTFSLSKLGVVLNQYISRDAEGFFNRYLHDFIHIHYKVNSYDEIVILSEGFKSAVFENINDPKRKESSIKVVDNEFKLCWLYIHLVNDLVYERLQNVLYLTTTFPDISPFLKDYVQNRSVLEEMVLDALSLQVCCELLNDHFEKNLLSEQHGEWFKEIQKVKPVVEQILSTKDKYGRRRDKILDDCRPLWQKISLVGLFIENVYLTATESKEKKEIGKKLKLFWKGFRENINMKSAESFKVLRMILQNLNVNVAKIHLSGGVDQCSLCLEPPKDPVVLPCDDVNCQNCILNWLQLHSIPQCPKCKKVIPEDYELLPTRESREAVERHGKFRQRCNLFFIEVLSRYCFSGNSPPDDTVIKELIRLITVNKNENLQTRNMTVFDVDYVDPTPVIRSYLLKLLLPYRNSLEHHLNDFLQESYKIIGQDEELNILVLDSLEDYISTFPLHSSEMEAKALQIAVSLLQKFSSYNECQELNLSFLEAVASIRFSLRVYAFVLYKNYNSKSKKTQNVEHLDQNLFSILELLVKELVEVHHNKTTNFIQQFLIQILSLDYNLDFVYKLKKNHKLQWIVPVMLQQEEDSRPDYFVVLGDEYVHLRKTMSEALIKKDFNGVKDLLQSGAYSNEQGKVIVFAALLTEVTSQKSLDLEFNEALKSILNTLEWPQHLKNMAELLSHPEMVQLNPYMQQGEDRILSTLVYHWIFILLCKSHLNNLLRPFTHMTSSPAMTANMFYPTMEEDFRIEAQALFKETTWYECVNGHPYTVANCGAPMIKSKCSECGSDIGGTNHNSVQGVTEMKMYDPSKQGHILGDSDSCPAAPVAVRKLGTLHLTIVRFCMHASMLYGGMHAPQEFRGVIKPPVQDVVPFIWKHLELNFQQLQRALNQSVEDTAVSIHLFFDAIGNKRCTVQYNDKLATKADRALWEEAFADVILPNVFQYCNTYHKDSKQRLLTDERVSTNHLFQIIYKAQNVIPIFHSLVKFLLCGTIASRLLKTNFVPSLNNSKG